jgi:hypothetical protein
MGSFDRVEADGFEEQYITARDAVDHGEH